MRGGRATVFYGQASGLCEYKCLFWMFWKMNRDNLLFVLLKCSCNGLER